MKQILTAVLLLHFSLAFAQADNKLYISKVKEICPDAHITEVERKSTYIEIEYLCDDLLVETGFGMNGEWLYTETEATLPESLKEKIHKRLEKNYADWTVDDYSLVKMADTSFYKVELIRDGVEENAYFTKDGKYYHSKNNVNDEPWNLEGLKSSAAFKSANYNFAAPAKIFDMPDLLKEISGIAMGENGRLFCVQDELGIVFEYDTRAEDISGIFRFTDIRDFEDVAIVYDKIFKLPSDAALFSFNYRNFNGKVSKINVPVNCLNLEGLDYNVKNGLLYLACKDANFDHSGNDRIIYAFDPEKQTNPSVLLQIKGENISRVLTENYVGANIAKVRINPSAVAVHPRTGELYVLSAAGRMIAVYEGDILKNVFPLPAEIYYKPEGLAFAASGDLYISSEGIKNGYVEGQIFFLPEIKR